MNTKPKQPGARTQYVVQPDGSKQPIRVRSINPHRESKYARAAAARTQKPPSAQD